MDRVILAYVPVLHRGYDEFFERHPDARPIYLLGEELIAEFDHLRKDIRALAPAKMRRAIAGLKLTWLILPGNILIADHSTLARLRTEGVTVIMPDEDVSRELAEKYLGGCSVEFDSVFLRRDKKRTVEEVPVSPDVTISQDEFHRRFMSQASEIASRSPDWWYHVGALVVREGEVLLAAFNSYVPSPHTAYAFGDPRIHFKAGASFELTQVLHAEAAVICEAARRGMSLEGTDLYTTMFPCPWCAKMVAYAGIRRLFFREGYSRLDGEDILRAKGVEIIRVT